MNRLRVVLLLAVSAIASVWSVPANAAPVDPCRLLEMQSDPTTVDYMVDNFMMPNSFDIVMLAVSFPGGPVIPPSPVAPSGWMAQALTEADWDLEMGGHGSGRATWAQFTGMMYSDVFDPAGPAVGYFADYMPDPNGMFSYVPGEPIMPGEMLGGFERMGMVASTFIVAGPPTTDGFTGNIHDDPIEGIDTFVGEPVIVAVPEPATMALLALGVGALGMARRRGRALLRPPK